MHDDPKAAACDVCASVWWAIRDSIIREAMELVGKRGLQELGSRINHVAGQGMSAWARKLLEKQGAFGDGMG